MFTGLLQSLDLDFTRVNSPPPRIMLCGGPCGDKEKRISVRDALYRSPEIEKKAFYNYLVLPEDIFKIYLKAGYPDLLTFERDVAELSTLTIVIPEGPGSIAELGAFSVLKEINSKLLVVIHDLHVKEESFILQGPLKFLEDIADNVVSVFSWALNDDGKFIGYDDVAELVDHLDDVIDSSDGFLKLKKDVVGHQLMLLLGFLAIVHLATKKELLKMFEKLGLQVDKDMFTQRLKLLEYLKLVVVQRYSSKVYYLLVDRDHIYFKPRFSSNAQITDVARWQTYFRNEYEKDDPSRYKALKKALKEQEVTYGTIADV